MRGWITVVPQGRHRLPPAVQPRGRAHTGSIGRAGNRAASACPACRPARQRRQVRCLPATCYDHLAGQGSAWRSPMCCGVAGGTVAHDRDVEITAEGARRLARPKASMHRRCARTAARCAVTALDWSKMAAAASRRFGLAGAILRNAPGGRLARAVEGQPCGAGHAGGPALPSPRRWAAASRSSTRRLDWRSRPGAMIGARSITPGPPPSGRTGPCGDAASITGAAAALAMPAISRTQRRRARCW